MMVVVDPGEIHCGDGRRWRGWSRRQVWEDPSGSADASCSGLAFHQGSWCSLMWGEIYLMQLNWWITWNIDCRWRGLFPGWESFKPRSPEQRGGMKMRIFTCNSEKAKWNSASGGGIHEGVESFAQSEHPSVAHMRRRRLRRRKIYQCWKVFKSHPNVLQNHPIIV